MIVSTERSGNGAERAEKGVSESGAVSGHSRKRLSGSGAGGRGTEQRAGVTKIGLSAERQIGRSRSAHMLCATQVVTYVVELIVARSNRSRTLFVVVTTAYAG